MKNTKPNNLISSVENVPLILGLFYFIARPFIVWIHELGHAIPIVLLSKKGVKVYIGSYGDPTKSVHFKIGPFEFSVKKNPILWNKGVCIPQSDYIEPNHQILYIILGPIAALVAGLLVFISYLVFDFSTYVSIFCVSFLICSIVDVLYNLIPNDTPFKMYDGTLNYNDGKSIRKLWKHRKYYAEYNIGAKAYINKQYEEAATVFERILLIYTKEKNIHQLVISSYFFSGNLEKAATMHDAFENTCTLDSDDYSKAGYLYAKVKQYDKAIYYFDKLLSIDPINAIALNNKAYTLNLLQNYSEAITYFEKVIELNPEDVYAYSNIGLSKFKSGLGEEGLADIAHSISLNDVHSYSYRNLGIYHLDQKEFPKALELFYKAEKLDPDTHLIQDLITQAKNNIITK